MTLDSNGLKLLLMPLQGSGWIVQNRFCIAHDMSCTMQKLLRHHAARPMHDAKDVLHRAGPVSRSMRWSFPMPYVNGGLSSGSAAPGSADVLVGKANGRPMDSWNDSTLALHSQANEDVGVGRLAGSSDSLIINSSNLSETER
ncbi:MAG: hypothetical protein ACO3JG_03870 [Luteolibacter sp.]